MLMGCWDETQSRSSTSKRVCSWVSFEMSALDMDPETRCRFVDEGYPDNSSKDFLNIS